MPISTDIVAYLGAAAWLPQIAAYTAVFAIKSSNRAKLAKATFKFSLTQQDVDGLHRNLEVMQPNYENVVLTGTEGYEPKAVNWDWKNVPFRKS